MTNLASDLHLVDFGAATPSDLQAQVTTAIDQANTF